MARRVRMSKVKFDSKAIIDVIGASLIVQQAPKLIDQVIQLDPMLRTVAGVGVGYLTGSMLKRPGIANAAIALGAVDFIAPFVENLFGGSSPTMLPAPSGAAPTKTMPPISVPDELNSLGRYFSLNDYVSNPSVRMSFDAYRDNYSY